MSTQSTITQKQLNASINAYSQTQPVKAKPMTPKRGRPRKKKLKVDNLNDASITPVANGYLVTSSDTKNEVFVFEELDKAFEFIKTNLKPTGVQQEFLDAV